MRKKYLSALLFGALLFASAGTFTSCKDYDDDINNLQSQITANADAIKALQDLVNNGDYVTKVAKNADGNLVFTFSKSGDQIIELDAEQVGDVLSINTETGELMKNGEPTGWFATKNVEDKNCIKIGEDGCWQLLQDDGTYKSTNIPVSGVTASQNTETQEWTLTIVDAQGNSQQVVVPSAASVMKDLELMGWIDEQDIIDGKLSLDYLNDVNNDDRESGLTVKYRYITTFTLKNGANGEKAPESWSAQKDVTKKQVLTTLAANETQLVARVAPADLDLSTFDFTLQDSKGNVLPIGLNKAAKFNGVLTRATESSISLIPLDVTSATYNTVGDYTKLFPGDERVYSLVTGSNNRSTYGEFAVTAEEYKNLRDVIVTGINPEGTTTDGNAGSGKDGDAFILDLNTPTVLLFNNDGKADDYSEQVYDYYVVPADEQAAKEFGFSTDKKNGTITLTKSIDLVTKTGLELYVYALRIDGTIYKQSVWVKPSSIMASAVTLKAGEQNITPIFDEGVITADGKTQFTVSLDDMFSQMSDTDKQRWLSSVTGANAGITVSDIKENGQNIPKLNNKVNIQFIDKDGKLCGTDGLDNTKAAGLLLTVDYKDGTSAILTPYKEYSMTVSFLHDEKEGTTPSVLNTVGLTVTPTLPKLSDYMTKRAAYWDGNVQMAYFDDPSINPTPATGKYLESKYDMTYGFTKLGWFDKADVCILDIDFSLDADQKIGDDKVVDKISPIANTGDCKNEITLGTVGTAGTKPFGYGEELNVKVGATYLDVYKYSDYDVTKTQLSDAAYKINVRSALEAGTIAPADGTSITLTPSGASQMMQITAKDIKATAYNLDSPYNVFKDVVRNGKAVWGYNYINNVMFTTPDDKLYQVVDKDGNAGTSAEAIDPTVDKGAITAESYVSLKGRNTTDGTQTTIKVTVTDWYGYTKVVDLPIVIKKANTGE